MDAQPEVTRYVRQLALQARAAARKLAALDTDLKNRALRAMAGLAPGGRFAESEEPGGS